MTVSVPWQGHQAPPTRPFAPLPDLALDGYLTGVTVAPRPISLPRWLAALWRDEQYTLWDARRVKAERDAILLRQTALAAKIDRHLAKLEADRVCDYRPAFMLGEGKPAHDAIRRWTGGFYTAMALVPDAWTALLEDDRTQILVAPFVGFMGVEDAEPFELAEDVDQRLDNDAAFIPRAILILRKLAGMRAAEDPDVSAWSASVKVGRNDLCPCGSGAKYKRCCGRN
jgi:uncharacterized protein